MLFVYFFELWWVPTAIFTKVVYNFFKNWRKPSQARNSEPRKNKKSNVVTSKDSFRKSTKETPTVAKDLRPDAVEDDRDNNEEDSDEDAGEGKKSLKQSLDQLQNLLQEIQTGSGMIASYLEKVENTFNF